MTFASAPNQSPPFRRVNRRRTDTHVGSSEGNNDRWLLTYSDMITLLLVLFIVLFALSKVDQAKYREFKQSMTKAVLAKTPHGTVTVQSQRPNNMTLVDRLVLLRHELSEALKSHGLLSDVTFSLTSAGLVEGLVADSTFFVSASAKLSSVGTAIVDVSAQTLRNFPNAIEVAGYTDNRSISDGPYPNNWALSAARASTVVIRMTQVDGLNPRQVVLIGYGQYHPVAPNTTPAGRAENRRVNIVIKPTAKFGM